MSSASPSRVRAHRPHHGYNAAPSRRWVLLRTRAALRVGRTPTDPLGTIRKTEVPPPQADHENAIHFFCGAADALERDRRTIRKALREVPPDVADRRGHPRWRLPTILTALEKHNRRTGNVPPHNGDDDQVNAALRELAVITNRLLKKSFCEALGV